jgi:hypothetical protein
MSKALLLVPADRQVTGAIAKALAVATERRLDLVAAVVVDTGDADRLSARMMDVGVLGEKISDQVSAALTREHRLRGEAVLAEVAEQAQARGVRCETRLEIGDPGDVCRRLVESEDVRVAVLVVEKRSWIGRVLTRAQPLRPPVLGGCEVVLVDED